VWCVEGKKTKTLIGCYMLLEKNFNRKFGEVIHGGVTLLLAVFSLDSNLVCEFYGLLSEEWSVATQKEEQRLCASPRVTKVVRTK